MKKGWWKRRSRRSNLRRDSQDRESCSRSGSLPSSPVCLYSERFWELEFTLAGRQLFWAGE